MRAIKDFLDILEKPNKQLTFFEKFKKFIGFIIVGLFGMLLLLVVSKSRERKSIEQEKRNKLKYFKPSIKEGIFSNTITWIMRDEPLSEESLDELMKEINL